MSSNILDPAALTTQLVALLPQSNRRVASAHDGLAALVHVTFTTLGFRLIAIDDTSSARTFPNNVLPEDWNTRGLTDHCLRYRHEQSSLEFLVKVVSLGQRTLINAIALESDKSASLDVSTNDFTSPSFYPYDASKVDAPPFVHGFISSNRIADFVSQLKLKVIQKLVPGLRKEGYTEEAEEVSTSATAANPPQAARLPRPRPVTPPFPEDIPYNFPQNRRPYNPLEIGRRDLDPFGAGTFAPPSLFPPHGGDGMFVGPDHPIFGSRDWGRRPEQPRGPWGGDGYLPPLGAPLGARFDPVGPDPNNPLRPTFGGRPRRGGFNTGEPDNDEFMPPGAGDMFM
ncbi:PI31 proteasome regulator N-terminal-domain-containing protein [Boletus edulis BED1]|uniref:PI31 proteasome regulator N-terminal-domain-containing protein n=1 Tax=Boletus edulis BED1 TaxID=1328754 RepID=A0AAD4GLV0_BOLED|nr:PI31 proteasome regulator N-terminal-domain-containing protein [Boletus edulis BED1]